MSNNKTEPTYKIMKKQNIVKLSSFISHLHYCLLNEFMVSVASEEEIAILTEVEGSQKRLIIQLSSSKQFFLFILFGIFFSSLFSALTSRSSRSIFPVVVWTSSLKYHMGTSYLQSKFSFLSYRSPPDCSASDILFCRRRHCCY